MGQTPARVNPRLVKKECRRILLMLKIMSLIDRKMVPDPTVVKNAMAFFNKKK